MKLLLSSLFIHMRRFGLVGLLAVIVLETFLISQQRAEVATLKTRISRATSLSKADKSTDASNQSSPDEGVEAGPSTWLTLRPERPLKKLKNGLEDRGNPAGKNIPLFLRSPELRAAQNALQKRFVWLKYGLLFKKLNLTQEQIDQATTQLLNRDNLPRDITVAVVHNLDSNGKSDLIQNMKLARNLTEAGNNDIKDGLRTILGEAGFSAYLDYDAHLPQYATIISLQQSLAAGTSETLSSAQIETLAELLGADDISKQDLALPMTNSNEYHVFEIEGVRFNIIRPKEVISMGREELDADYIPSDRIVAQIASARVLNSQQIAALQEIVARRVAARALFTASFAPQVVAPRSK